MDILSIFCVGLFRTPKGPVGFDETFEKPMVWDIFLPEVHAQAGS